MRDSPHARVRPWSWTVLGDSTRLPGREGELLMVMRAAHPSRRRFLRDAALATAGAAAARALPMPSLRPGSPAAAARMVAPFPDLEEATIAELQRAMSSGRLTSLELTRQYLRRIAALDRRGPKLNSIVEVNPQALDIARGLDRERRRGEVRGPLHGIPIVIKENIDTADQMLTTAGSLALVDSMPAQDSTTAARLRDAGVVILGKANLSEWANFRGFFSSSGWSGRGGQTSNPYVIRWNPCGSSSGSGTASAANLAAATLGTETDGSIVCPSSSNGLVGIKPSVGLTSRAGVIPISHSQDTVGPMARTVADAAALLGPLTGVDPRDPATSESDGFFFDDYTQFLDSGGLGGARIGIAREMWGFSPEADAVCEATIAAMASAGATIVDPVLYPSIEEINSGEAEITVLLYEFKADLNAYLATRTPGSPRTLAELIAFNEANADIELRYFGQELFHLSEATTGLDDPAYLEALATARRIGREDGIDAVLEEHDLDAFVAPTGSPAWPTDLVNGDLFLGGSSSPAAVAGYPIVSMPAGFSFGLPVGISFVGARWSEPTLIRLASGFEAAVGARRPPRYLEQPDL